MSLAPPGTIRMVGSLAINVSLILWMAVLEGNRQLTPERLLVRVGDGGATLFDRES